MQRVYWCRNTTLVGKDGQGLSLQKAVVEM